ncbi:hypothetical protein VMCG_04424 [Cytospora schulzeri]|uniref:Uncharacterized protein n=1 Tax=Cytospora schulzeri TaxID=448051 RepID=A0A423WSD6_9PEZI|nr:hypothetical protein VMCG_04424 [Valsa malicola]
MPPKSSLYESPGFWRDFAVATYEITAPSSAMMAEIIEKARAMGGWDINQNGLYRNMPPSTYEQPGLWRDIALAMYEHWSPSKMDLGQITETAKELGGWNLTASGL